MNIQEKISALRQIMKREKLDAYIISGSDPHNSEYIPDTWKQREWISGFTGSYGTVVITETEAGLWTDSRYFIQATQELIDTDIELHKLETPNLQNYPVWLLLKLNKGARVGFDSYCHSMQQVESWAQLWKQKNITIVPGLDLLGEIWLDRPAIPTTPVYAVLSEYAGQNIANKLNVVRQHLSNIHADYQVLTCLDEIAWTFNIRGNDIAYNPLTISYAIIGHHKAWLFIKHSKLSSELITILTNANVEIRDYYQIFLFANDIETNNVFSLDGNTINYALGIALKNKFKIVDNTSPIILQKAIKNKTEIAGFRQACLQEGIVLTRFFHWLEDHINKGISETEASEMLSKIRFESADCIGESFHTISAYGSNAAMPHYNACKGEDAIIEPKGFYLVDTGGQYKYGTTDITRTMVMGELSDLEKEDYTLVLKGMINLATAVFPKGTIGFQLDALARIFLWKAHRNFGHGTGHGIGHILCVHEGPQNIASHLINQSIEPGMVTSDEPGIYRENLYGIRHENMIVCHSAESNEFGEFRKFEVLSLCYIDTKGIEKSLMTFDELQWLNNYNQSVFEKISPYLKDSDKTWLAAKVAAI